MNWKILSAYVAGAAVLVLVLTHGGDKKEISGRARAAARRPAGSALFPSPGLSYDTAALMNAAYDARESANQVGISNGGSLLPTISLTHVEAAQMPEPSAEFSGLWTDGPEDESFPSAADLFSTTNQELEAHRPTREKSALP